MADYSWVVLQFESTNEEVVEEVRKLFGRIEDESTDWPREGCTTLQAETSYGLAKEAEAYLMEHGIAYSRFSDGKYEYDGDEAHWKPGMPEPRTFPRLNNGGRVFTEADYRQNADLADWALGRYLREWFEFQSPVSPDNGSHRR